MYRETEQKSQRQFQKNHQEQQEPWKDLSICLKNENQRLSLRQPLRRRVPPQPEHGSQRALTSRVFSHFGLGELYHITKDTT